MPTIEELKTTYSQLSNKRLSVLLGEKESLLPEARQLLEEEAQRRNLNNEIEIVAVSSKIGGEAGASPASIGKRFLNNLIDRAAIVVTLFIFILGGDDANLGLVALLFPVAFYFYNYIYLEGKHGKTIGKFITKTTAYKQDGSTINISDAFKRALCRFIPLDFLFVLLDGNLALHDRFTETYVADDESHSM